MGPAAGRRSRWAPSRAYYAIGQAVPPLPLFGHQRPHRPDTRRRADQPLRRRARQQSGLSRHPRRRASAARADAHRSCARLRQPVRPSDERVCPGQPVRLLQAPPPFMGKQMKAPPLLAARIDGPFTVAPRDRQAAQWDCARQPDALTPHHRRPRSPRRRSSLA